MGFEIDYIIGTVGIAEHFILMAAVKGISPSYSIVDAWGSQTIKRRNILLSFKDETTDGQQ